MNISRTVKRTIIVIAVVICVLSLAACGNTEETKEKRKFPKFEGTDFEGNAVDETLFSENNAWACTYFNYHVYIWDKEKESSVKCRNSICLF